MKIKIKRDKSSGQMCKTSELLEKKEMKPTEISYSNSGDEENHYVG